MGGGEGDGGDGVGGGEGVGGDGGDGGGGMNTLQEALAVSTLPTVLQSYETILTIRDASIASCPRTRAETLRAKGPAKQILPTFVKLAIPDLHECLPALPGGIRSMVCVWPAYDNDTLLFVVSCTMSHGHLQAARSSEIITVGTQTQQGCRNHMMQLLNLRLIGPLA